MQNYIIIPENQKIMDTENSKVGLSRNSITSITDRYYSFLTLGAITKYSQSVYRRNQARHGSPYHALKDDINCTNIDYNLQENRR